MWTNGPGSCPYCRAPFVYPVVWRGACVPPARPTCGHVPQPPLVTMPDDIPDCVERL